MNFIIFYIGSCLGSFCDLVSFRLLKKEQWVFGRSYCDFCKKKLRLIHLLPLLSFVFLKGRCPYCQRKIPIRHSLIEILGGLGLCMLYNTSSFYILKTIIMMILLIISLMDIEKMYFNGELLLILLISSIFYAICMKNTIYESLLGAICISLPLLLFKRFIGDGDLWIITIMGIALKTQGIIIAFSMAVYSCIFITMYLLWFGKKNKKDPIPFCPFLSLGVIFALMFCC